MNEILNKKILIVDDEPELLNTLKDSLYKAGFFNLYSASNCGEALRIVKSHQISLCVLDVNLPDGDGFSLFDKIKLQSPSAVIFLTARGDADDRIRGLGLGADDYIVKPFLAKELILRITAVLRRIYSAAQPNAGFKLTDRTVSFETASVSCGDTETFLTAKEFILLKKLYENKNKIVTSDALCMAAWGDGYYGYENTLMVHIRRLRKKIEPDPSAPKHIICVKGLGYKLVIDDE